MRYKVVGHHAVGVSRAAFFIESYKKLRDFLCVVGGGGAWREGRAKISKSHTLHLGRKRARAL